MPMNRELRQLLEELPERLPRSKLFPYSELIAEMRCRNYSYREIARFLAEHCEVHITHNAVRNYVKRRCLESHGAFTSPDAGLQDASIAGASSAESQKRSTSREGMEAVRERIAALKTRRHAETPEGPSFRFDPSQPLRLTDQES